MGKTGPIFKLLKDRRFAVLWGMVQLSFLGMFVHIVAAAWAMTELTDSKLMVALVQTAQALPIVLFSVVAGAFADTYDRRLILFISLSLSLLASALLALAAQFGFLTPWLMLGLICVVGTGVAFIMPTWMSVLGEVFDRVQLRDAISVQNIGANAMRTVGPMFGGVLVAAGGAAPAFLVGAFSYLPGVVAVLFWRRSVDTPKDRESVINALTAGLQFLLVSPQLLTLLLRVLLFSLAGASVLSLLPLIAQNQLELGADGFGALFGGFGFGAVLGGFSLAAFGRRMPPEKLSRFIMLANSLSIGALALSTGFWPGLIAAAVSGACWLMGHSLHNTALQLASPSWIGGRIAATFMTAAFLGLACGGWLWGLCAELLGTRGALGLALVTMALTLILAWRWPMPETENLDFEPLQIGPERELGVTMPTRAGPVHVSIEYRISGSRVADFERLMHARRLHLTRLGARHWRLLQDLGSQDIWIEQFQVRSWGDYERLMERRTADTASLRKRINAIQQDRWQPRVQILVPKLAKTSKSGR